MREHKINLLADARAVFEMTVRRLSSKPENVVKTKPLLAFLHEYESRYGDLGQVINLENRIRELFPDDPTLSQFAHRYVTNVFDPIAAKPVISLSQVRPRAGGPLLDQQHVSSQDSAAHYLEGPSTGSPKRPFPSDDFGDDGNRPRKFVRAESPLKGIPARRPDQLKRPLLGSQAVNGSGQHRPQPSAAPLPRDVVHLLSIIPPASAYNAGRFSAEKLVELIRRIDIPSSTSQLRSSMHPAAGMGSQSYGGK